MTTWTSAAGVEIRDLVPAELRRRWVLDGLCPGRGLYELFAEHAAAHPDRQAVVDDEGSLDYAGLHDEVRRIAAALAGSGFGARDVIGIQMPNGRLAVATELAVYALGAVALPLTAGDASRLLRRCRAATLLRDLSDLGAPAPGWQPGTVDAEWPARFLVSTGSEAEPKAVAYSHNAFAGGRANYVRALHDGDGPMRSLVLVPLASSFGSLGVPVTIAALGGTLLLRPGAFDPAAALRVIAEHRPTHVFGVPTMLRRMAESPQVADTSSLRAVVSSAAALPETTVQRCRERLCDRVITVYGSSDGVNCHTARTGIGPDSGTGLPDPTVAEIRIVDGEICARGPMTPLSYVAAPELDELYRLPGGWVRTGDRGELDAEGRLHMLGRIKQIVKRGGYSISLAEVEGHLGTHPNVTDVACIAVPDDDLGERMCACVVLHADAPALVLKDITRFLEQERGLDRRKLPELLVTLPALPLGPTGKHCRHTLTRIVTEPEHAPTS